MEEKKTNELSENLISKAKHYYPTEYNRILSALNMATSAHEGQLRASGYPYITHPIQVADILIDLGLDSDTICAALLHDTIEDTSVTEADIKKSFGDVVAELVQGVTKLDKLFFNSIEEEQAENIRKMFLAMSKDIRVLIIKLADRLHNMRSLGYLKPERQQAMARETIEIYAPLAGRLGISPIKCELEDYCLKYLDRSAYDYLAENIAQTKQQRQIVVEEAITQIKAVIEEGGIEAEVSGRTKHFYSIYKKMRNQHKTLDQIYDLTAVRVIVDSVKDCFAVLGLIHAKWKPIPGRFKDYIAVPKPNMYQSLHTTVITNFGIPLEIQIRTHEMHRIAEYGIAAHWKYKEGRTAADPLDDKLKWIKEVLSYETDIKDSKEFLDLIRGDMTVNEDLYVFTPKGDVRVLPYDATAIDFAYAIHSEVGNHCVGIKINGKIAPLNSGLQTGDVVEVLINQSSKGPSRDWMKICKTSSARAKIRQFFKRELRDENIRNGKTMMEHDAKRKGFTLPQLLTPEALESVFERYTFANSDEMYAAVGYGGVSSNQILTKLIATNHQLGKLVEPVEIKKPTATGKLTSVIVKGFTDLLVRFSKCCSPVPGDEIIGYISRGRGVCIHRTDCPSLKSLEPERLVEADWVKTSDNAMYPATVQVISEDKVGVFAEIAKIVAAEGLSLLAVNARKDKNHNAVSMVTVEISNQQQVEQLIAKIKNVSTTIQVFRTTK